MPANQVFGRQGRRPLQAKVFQDSFRVPLLVCSAGPSSQNNAVQGSGGAQEIILTQCLPHEGGQAIENGCDCVLPIQRSKSIPCFALDSLVNRPKVWHFLREKGAR